MQVYNHRAMDWLSAEHFRNQSDCCYKPDIDLISKSHNVLNVKR